MGKPETKDDTPKVPDPGTTLVLFGTVADTSWRMFVPVIGLLIIGIWQDRVHDTKPWLTIVGLAFGCLIALLLVRSQYKRVTKNGHK